ncbi:hypothetical protein AALP_AA2G153100 [Arabis alpina]|uniref:Uncharacterized protein n=1 Tax=Arabis alpina TaxID=50452 RepID=A0A087HHN2_ARAAL|nr:hypothetical protein AALP_AA2G153100 [Arabis alpina]
MAIAGDELGSTILPVTIEYSMDYQGKPAVRFSSGGWKSARIIISIGQGGYKSCIKIFGADQFDGNDPKEAKDKSSFFNWVMFGSCVSI